MSAALGNMSKLCCTRLHAICNEIANLSIDKHQVSRVFNGFFLAAFEAGGNRPQPQGLRANVSRLGSQVRR